MNRNIFIEKRHSARVSYSLSTICVLQLKHDTRNVTDHYTTSYNRNLYIAMYARAELFCVSANVTVMCYGYYANGFRFEFHVANFRFDFFSVLLFKLRCYV